MPWIFNRLCGSIAVFDATLYLLCIHVSRTYSVSHSIFKRLSLLSDLMFNWYFSVRLFDLLMTFFSRMPESPRVIHSAPLRKYNAHPVLLMRKMSISRDLTNRYVLGSICSLFWTYYGLILCLWNHATCPDVLLVLHASFCSRDHGFGSSIQERKTNCLLSIRKLLACPGHRN